MTRIGGGDIKGLSFLAPSREENLPGKGKGVTKQGKWGKRARGLRKIAKSHIMLWRKEGKSKGEVVL